MHKFSVVIPLYNKEKHIERAIRSALSQTLAPDEILVIDDGSTDKGAQIAGQIQDHRLRIIHQENQGVSAARNRGIKEANHAWIAFLDADDAWKPDFLETIEHLIQKFPSGGIYATAYETYLGERGTAKVAYHFIPEAPWEGVIPRFFGSMLGNPPVWSSATVIKKAVFDTVGYFVEGQTVAEDVEMWCRIALVFDVVFCTQVCSIYFQDAENRAYVMGKKHHKPDAYLHTLQQALLKNNLSDRDKEDIRQLIERIELGHSIMLIMSGNPAEARENLSKNVLQYYKKDKYLWYMLSMFSPQTLQHLMSIKNKLKKISK